MAQRYSKPFFLALKRWQDARSGTKEESRAASALVHRASTAVELRETVSRVWSFKPLLKKAVTKQAWLVRINIERARTRWQIHRALADAPNDHREELRKIADKKILGIMNRSRDHFRFA